jgi:hypothetical protein
MIVFFSEELKPELPELSLPPLRLGALDDEGFPVDEAATRAEVVST